MLNFQALPLIRLLRVIGGISMLLLLSAVPPSAKQGYFELHGIPLYVLFFTSLLFFIYHLYITYHRIKHIKKILQSSELDIHR
jgi:hypothetical protein